MLEQTCIECGGKFNDYPARKRKYCSLKCYRDRSRRVYAKKYQKNCVICGVSFRCRTTAPKTKTCGSKECFRGVLRKRRHSKDTKNKIQQSVKNYWKNRVRVGKPHTKEEIEKIKKSCVGINKKEKNGNWKGGISSKNNLLRNSPKYKEWRTAVFERDKYTCQRCRQKGGKLNAHHVKPWAKYPKLRYELDNGLTLCVKCHKLAHKK